MNRTPFLHCLLLLVSHCVPAAYGHEIRVLFSLVLYKTILTLKTTDDYNIVTAAIGVKAKTPARSADEW